MRRAIPIFLLAVFASAPVYAQQDRKLTHGASVQVITLVAESIQGELLAATPDSVWVLGVAAIRAVAMRDVVRVRINRNAHGAAHGMVRSLIFGTVSGIALYSACSSVDGNEGCGEVIAFSIGASALIGALASPSLENVRFLTLQAPKAETLRAWARFPQGLPMDVPREAFVRPISR